jgi:hypothetical protein
VKNNRTRLMHELAMLVTICILQVWRLTGVPLHEYLGAALAVAVFVHVLMQRGWVAASVRKLRSMSRRAKVNLALNAALFLAFTAAVVSGVAISKVLLPQNGEPSEFLRWHGLHDLSSKLVLLLIGLHVALNLDALVAPARRMLDASSRAVPARAGAGLQTARFAGALTLVMLVAAGAVYGIEKVLPPEEYVLIQGRDGRIQRVPPPRDLVELRPDQRRPDLSRGLPKFAVTAGLLALVAVTGRKVLRLRL